MKADAYIDHIIERDAQTGLIEVAEFIGSASGAVRPLELVQRADIVTDSTGVAHVWY